MEQQQELVAVMIMSGVTFVIVVLVLRYKLKQHRSYLGTLATGFEESSIVGSLTARLEARHNGFEVGVEPRPGGKNAPPMVFVRVARQAPFSLTVYPEGGVQRFFKRLGLEREIEVGYPEFDERFILKTNDELQAKAYLSSDKMRHAINAIFDRDYKHLRITPKHLEVYTVARDMENALLGSSIMPIVERLVELAEPFPG